MRRVVGLLCAAAISFVAISWWALESGGVAVVTTQRPDGTTRSTHVWYAVDDGGLWLEAGSPENGWFQDVRSSPRLRISIGGKASDHVAEPISTPEAHDRIRALLREKYGLRDRWVGLLVDSTRSIAVRLRPVVAAP